MTSNTPAVEALLISDTVACAMAGVSRATWWRLFAAAKTPSSVKLSRKRLWNKAEICGWIEGGCPPRTEWEARKAQARRLRVAT